jgi:hypothetical protein
MQNVIMLPVIMLSVVMLNVVNAECCYAECHYAECRSVDFEAFLLFSIFFEKKFSKNFFRKKKFLIQFCF